MADKNTPVDQVRIGAVKAVIWENRTDNGVLYNVGITRLYKAAGQWRDSRSFGHRDLLLLAKVANEAHSRIEELRRDG